MPAAPIEKLIAGAVRNQLTAHNELDSNRPAPLTDKDLISTYVPRVEIQPDHLAIHIQLSIASEQQIEDARDDAHHSRAKILRVPWEKPPSKQSREVLPPATSSSRQDQRPIRAETRAKLVTAIASARRWLDELVAGTINNVEEIADREKCSIRQINRAMTLAFLAPGLVQAAIDGCPEVSESQSCAAYRPNGPSNTSDSACRSLAAFLKHRRQDQKICGRRQPPNSGWPY